jgi:hypothetical protein
MEGRMAIYKYYQGYNEAKYKVEAQSMEDDLQLIDALYGRDNLSFGDGPKEIKREALRQLEINWREEVNEDATFWVNVANARRGV